MKQTVNMIFGHTWEEIQAMQQRTYRAKPITASVPCAHLSDDELKAAFLRAEELGEPCDGYRDAIVQRGIIL